MVIGEEETKRPLPRRLYWPAWRGKARAADSASRAGRRTPCRGRRRSTTLTSPTILWRRGPAAPTRQGRPRPSRRTPTNATRPRLSPFPQRTAAAQAAFAATSGRPQCARKTERSARQPECKRRPGRQLPAIPSRNARQAAARSVVIPSRRRHNSGNASRQQPNGARWATPPPAVSAAQRSEAVQWKLARTVSTDTTRSGKSAACNPSARNALTTSRRPEAFHFPATHAPPKIPEKPNREEDAKKYLVFFHHARKTRQQDDLRQDRRGAEHKRRRKSARSGGRGETQLPIVDCRWPIVVVDADGSVVGARHGDVGFLGSSRIPAAAVPLGWRFVMGVAILCGRKDQAVRLWRSGDPPPEQPLMALRPPLKGEKE